MGIGTLGEKSLHAALKDWYAGPDDRLEAVVDGYVVDIVRGDLLIEIQVANFSAIRRKLAALTENHRVRLVHPIAEQKWIVRQNGRGKPVGRRKSPKRGRVEHIFDELVRIPVLVPRPNLAVEVLLVHVDQILRNDGKGSWRRRGWSIVDERLLGVTGRVLLESPADFLALLPANLPEPFTTRDLADALGDRRSFAQRMAYCLREMGAIQVVGKNRNELRYARSE
jgi:hypothetical protein